ncbi:unnamed protein product [Candida parapsilosis]
MDRYQDKIKPRSRPVSAIISTTTTNVTSHDHGTLFSPSSATSLNGNISSQTQTPPAKANISHNANIESGPIKLLQTPRYYSEKETKKSSSYITKKDILRNELRTTGLPTNNEPKHNRIELQFLVSIYAPGLRPLRNASLVERIKSRLPKIVDGDLDVNFSLHLFLSTIMVKFVNSWYLTKLNTSNVEFLRAVYDDVLVVLVRDLASRVTCLSSCDLLHLADDLISILNTHLKEFANDENGNYSYKVVDGYYNLADTENSLAYDASKDPKDVLGNYLSQQHIIFDHKSDAQEEEQQLLYLRVMGTKILQKAMTNNAKDALFTSKITSDLLILILGDLVMAQIVKKISSSEFILGSLNNVVTSLLSMVKEREISKAQATVSGPSVITQFVALACTIYQSMFMLVSALKSCSGYDAPFDVINCSVFVLLGTLFRVDQTWPLVYTLALSMRTIILSILGLKNGINNVVSNFLMHYMSKTISTETISKVIDQLRIKLFYSEDKEVTHEDQHISLDTVVDNIVELFNHLPLMKQQHPDFLRNKIKRVLIIFAKDEELDRTNKVNLLLCIRLLDQVVYAIYNDI